MWQEIFDNGAKVGVASYHAVIAPQLLCDIGIPGMLQVNLFYTPPCSLQYICVWLFWYCMELQTAGINLRPASWYNLALLVTHNLALLVTHNLALL